MKIFKYQLQFKDEFTVQMAIGAKILSFGNQNGFPVLWALVNDKKDNEFRKFRLIGTGHPIDDIESLKYIGTSQFGGGDLIFHLFEKIVEKNEK